MILNTKVRKNFKHFYIFYSIDKISKPFFIPPTAARTQDEQPAQDAGAATAAPA